MNVECGISLLFIGTYPIARGFPVFIIQRDTGRRAEIILTVASERVE